MFRKRFKKILQASPFFARIRYSRFFLKCWYLLRPGVKSMLDKQKNYYRHFLDNLKPGQFTIFDIGANEGFVTAVFLETGLSVVAVEPDERNVLILKTRFQSNKSFQLYPGAVGAANGKLPFYRQNEGAALSTLSTKWKKIVEKGGYRFHSSYADQPGMVDAITIDQLVDMHGLPVLMKIDVEGYEAEVLKGLNHSVPLLLFEAILPEFMPETLECLEKLNSIEPGMVYSYGTAHDLHVKEFVNYFDFRDILKDIKEPTVDIICIAPSYFNYYSRMP